MNQDTFNSLFKTGDNNALWAAVENHIQGEVDAVKRDAASTITAKEKEIEDLNAKLKDLTSISTPPPVLAGSTLNQ